MELWEPSYELSKSTWSKSEETKIKNQILKNGPGTPKKAFFDPKTFINLSHLPAEDLIEKTFTLFAESEGDIFTMLGLSLHFGLRRNEAFHCRREWFDLDGDRARITVAADRDFRPKGGHEGFTLGSKAIAKSILNKASGDDLLITTRADYGRVLFDDLIKKLRAVGWERSSPLHELRKLFGSYVATTEGIYISQKFLRHADASTTNDSYADVMANDKIKALWAA